MVDVHVDSLMTDNVEGSGFVDCSNTEHELEQEKINHVNSIDNGKSNIVEPWIEMEFPTYIAAYDYYNDYAKIKGFSVRISSGNYSKKEGKELISKKFVCNKEGLKSTNDKREHGKIVKRQRDTRVGCKAMLRVNRTDKGTWIVSKLVNEHTNHELTSPDKVKNHYSHRKLHRTKDTTGTMRGVFWADGRAWASFLKFHDIVVFDVTYRTNKLALPFAPFTGVNHHWQLTLFGCALLADEEEDTFV
ncbi:protein FAR1-RELATED SEQUENCE 5-like [Asparagus officinalis]|uniref:protein FAR1-RELATED SEQUENCE 5-like n=1 Tax=Asparagus officinalis TaxID=4686 RepID=UPI00098E556E|nr:protein FAR1-RELATED SEQUENCE 5-like [Asparagus officinalis]